MTPVSLFLPGFSRVISSGMRRSAWSFIPFRHAKKCVIIYPSQACEEVRDHLSHSGMRRSAWSFIPVRHAKKCVIIYPIQACEEVRDHLCRWEAWNWKGQEVKPAKLLLLLSVCGARFQVSVMISDPQRHWDISNGSMQITFYRLSFDFYPFHPAGERGVRDALLISGPCGR